jgi:hypothetical protein
MLPFDAEASGEFAPAGPQHNSALLHSDSAFRLKALLYNVWSIRAFN